MFSVFLTMLAEAPTHQETVVFSWWCAGLWGFLGGFVADGLNYTRVLRQSKSEIPEHYFSAVFFLGVAIRLLIGAVLAIAFVLSGQISGAMGALVVGITAPAIVDKIIKQSNTSNTTDKDSDAK
jgi:hypothetical protein